jgi:hypothetical protein
MERVLRLPEGTYLEPSPNLIVGRAVENKMLLHLNLLHMENIVLPWNLMLDLYL